MSRLGSLFRAARVIARRDYVATVWSRSFLLFLLGPLIAALAGGVVGKISAQTEGVALQPVVMIVVEPKDEAPLRAAFDRLTERLTPVSAVREKELPRPSFIRPDGPPDVQARALLGDPKRNTALVVTGWPDAPRITGPSSQIEGNAPIVRLAMEDATAQRREIAIATTALDPAAGKSSVSRYALARGAQTILFVLTILLAGMLLSNLVEEKSNKVIEVLAAAVPVDAIFLGKLVAMLGVSLTGITVWGALLAGGFVATFQGGSVPQPGVGWPVFVVLGAAYYVMNYMILGGLFLGIGAQAATVRDVQTLSMPITMAQIAIFAAGSAVVNDLDTPMGLLAAVFPLTSPLTMVARAAQEGALWPHLIALAWQGLWVVLIIRFAARRFRVGVLKSGAPGGWFKKRAAH